MDFRVLDGFSLRKHEYSEECVFTYGWTKDLDPESIHK